MSRFQSEQERQEFQKQHIANLTAKANDPNLTEKRRGYYQQLLNESQEDQQVEVLFKAAEQSRNPEISAGSVHLVKIFMEERAEMLHQQQKPQTIGTPVDFFSWLTGKRRFR